MSVNKVFLLGNVGKDPDIRTAGEGRVANITIATTEKYKDKDGNAKENTEWHNCVAFGKIADVIAQYVKKGSQVYVEGKIKTESYEKDGKKNYSTKIYIGSLQLIGKAEKKGDNTDLSGFGNSEGFEKDNSDKDNDMPW